MWIFEPGTNKYLMLLIDNNSLLLGAFFGILFSILKYKAKQTPSPDDDELVNKIEGKIMGIFNRKVDEKLR